MESSAGGWFAAANRVIQLAKTRITLRILVSSCF
jgi:hypothetical protein